ncbi:hypothetical protein DES45_11457 [Microvirga subterranea]|uniref:Uncharacterized protein n=1 Tax=Microvirga subterranea TaxID=186651 RepID=A0A370H850_9HYPH|nr:hypothetical protein DES45_11457 [Microvirga subterranea]
MTILMLVRAAGLVGGARLAHGLDHDGPAQHRNTSVLHRHLSAHDIIVGQFSKLA